MHHPIRSTLLVTGEQTTLMVSVPGGSYQGRYVYLTTLDDVDLYEVEVYTWGNVLFTLIPQLAGRTKETVCVSNKYKPITNQSLGISQVWICVSSCIHVISF